MAIVVPIWFYEFGSAMYLVATFAAILLSYYSFKLFSITSKKQHILFHAAFVFISFGLLALTVGNLYSYINFESCKPQCQFNPVDPTYFWIRFGNYGYYLATLIGYSLLALSYFKTNRMKIFAAGAPMGIELFFQLQEADSVLYPFMNSYFQIFHSASIVLLTYIAIKTFLNYFRTKTNDSLLVFSGFAAIEFYHVLMFLIPFDPSFFALAHFSLLFGFSSLLLMVAQVNRK